MTSGAAAQQATPADSTTRAKVRELLVLTGSDETTRIHLGNLFTTLNPDGDHPMVTALQNDLTVEVLTEMVVDLYAEHFTAEEIDEITAFYDSAFGRKYISLRPVLAQETIAAARSWMEDWITAYEEGRGRSDLCRVIRTPS